jgi:hypothetical protein
MITWLRYVPHGQMLQFLAKGWELSDELHGSSHGNWSVLMRWAGEGEPS